MVKTLSDDDIKTIADLLEAAGLEDLSGDNAQRVRRELWRRKTASITDENERHRLAWEDENPGYITAADFYEKYIKGYKGLHHAWRKFHDSGWFEHPKKIRHGIRSRYIYFEDSSPAPETIEALKKQATLSKRQACEVFGLTPYQFDRLKKQHDLKHIGGYRAGTNAGGGPNVGFLYSYFDVEQAVEKG